ncbi:MAG TPA: hypothetical protein VFB27_02855, partial [Opitutaceae bacterium]|nr:hypothetical protein [Opitutaceae bacterium]
PNESSLPRSGPFRGSEDSFGRESHFPAWVNESLEHPSQVILGAPEVKEYIPSIRAEDLPGAVRKN